jgi:hypothetical protein
MRMDGLAVVAELTDRTEADLLVAALTSEGIPAAISEDSHHPTPDPLDRTDPVVEILVPAGRLEKAVAVLNHAPDPTDTPPPHRALVIVPIYLMFALVVLILVAGAIAALASSGS